MRASEALLQPLSPVRPDQLGLWASTSLGPVERPAEHVDVPVLERKFSYKHRTELRRAASSPRLFPRLFNVLTPLDSYCCSTTAHKLYGITLLQKHGRGPGVHDLALRKRLQNHYSTPLQRIKRKTYVILRERGRRGPRTGDVVQLRQMQMIRVAVLILETMEHGRHPPGKALHLPNAPQTNL